MLAFLADYKSLTVVALYFATTYVCWTQCQALSSLAFASALLGLLSFVCSIIVHNSMHVRVFAVREMEPAWRLLLSLSYGHPANTFISGHNKTHHAYTETEKDPMNTKQMRCKYQIQNLLLFWPTVVTPVARSDWEFFREELRIGSVLSLIHI